MINKELTKLEMELVSNSVKLAQKSIKARTKKGSQERSEAMSALRSLCQIVGDIKGP